MILTIDVARDIATDTANRQMAEDGRKSWSRKDFNLACRTLNLLIEKYKL